jgi:exopolysaccharide production protein ExoQ
MMSIACIFYLLMSTGALGYFDRIIYGEWYGKPGDKLTQALNLLAIGISLLLFWWGTRRQRSPLFNRALPLGAAGLLVISALWSVAPSTTVTRGVAYFFLLIGAIGIGEIFDSHKVIRLTALIGGFLGAVSLILPDAAIPYIGGLRGPLPSKNSLGEAMAIGVLAGLHGVRIGGRGRFLYLGIAFLCTLVAVFCNSATALVTIFAFFTLHFIGTLYVKGGGRRIISIALALVAAVIFIFFMNNMNLIFSLLGKDDTLTGRADFWPYIIDYIYQRPLLGWGFSAFFQSPDIGSMIGVDINEAHNSLLQLLLDIGIIGTAFFLFLWMRNLVMAVRCMHGPAPEIGASSLLYLVGILLMGTSEQVLTLADEPTALFFLLGFMCEKELWLAREAKAAVASRSWAALHPGRFASPREGDVV